MLPTKLFKCAIIITVCLLAIQRSTNVVYAALPGAHSDTVSGDVFLGGDYIELGISQYGSFGTDQNKPSSFFGTAARNQIGMSSDLDGFDTGTDWRMDFFMPGTQEERWSIGYTVSGTQTTASNAKRTGTTGISDNTVTNQSSGNTLKATSIGTLNSALKTTQVIQFAKGEKFFKNTVTLQNIHASSTLDSVRYMRSFDPDNTVDQGGSYTTQNTIIYTHAAGDGKAVVRADTSNSASDPVYTGTGGSSGGTRSPILFYSSDDRARVAYHSGLNPGTVYASTVYDSVQSKGSTEARDGAISIAFDVGALAPGESETFIYYTSLDERDFSEVEQDIQADEESNNATPTSQPTSQPTAPPGPPKCGMNKPLYAPDIFYIDPTYTQAKLYIAPPPDEVTGYVIEYGINPEKFEHATMFDWSDKSGAVPHIVNNLLPNMTWHFRVRSQNGCAIGPWSTVKSAATNKLALTILNSPTNQPPTAVLGAKNPTSTPITGTLCRYTVKEGDNLWVIARDIFGMGIKYPDLISHNQSTYPTIDQTIRPGWNLNYACP